MEYSVFWFSVLIAIVVVFISLAILFGLKIAYSEEIPYKECIEFSDGKLAIIKYDWVRCSDMNSLQYIISWFYSKGYHMVDFNRPENYYGGHTDGSIIMERYR